VDAILGAFSVPGEGGPIAAAAGAINNAFAADTVEAVLQNLDRAAAPAKAHSAWAAATAATIRTRCPTSLKIALAQVRRGRNMTFEECMRAEFRIVSRIVYGKDFYEGVRAVIIDKDNDPQWRPATLADVSDADVEQYFAPLKDELALP
jgi:enoyl-CoA hydratase